MHQVILISAYKQLDQVERRFVDSYIARIENEYAQNNERISNALYRPIDPDMVRNSKGMFERPLVMAAIAERINDLASETELTVHRIIKELKAIAFTSLGDLIVFDEWGIPTFAMEKATPEQLSAIKKWKETDTQYGGKKYEFEFYDKLTAIDKLCRYMGLFADDSPEWRAANARPVTAPSITQDDTINDTAFKYQKMIEG